MTLPKTPAVWLSRVMMSEATMLPSAPHVAVGILFLLWLRGDASPLLELPLDEFLEIRANVGGLVFERANAAHRLVARPAFMLAVRDPIRFAD
jgi:hypothetical protein